MQTDDEIISGIELNQDWAIAIIYKTQYQSIKKMVFSFRNIRLEPQDIFQEGLTRTILNIRAGKFRSESSLGTYLNKICRNICLKLVSRPDPVLANEDPVTEEQDNYYELLAFIKQIKNQLGENCREIIDLRFKQGEEMSDSVITDNKLHSFEEIARRLNITIENARQRFKRCMDQLRKMVFAHPEYQTLFD